MTHSQSPTPQPSAPFRTAVLRFINELRTAGLRVSVAESMDAMNALTAVDLEREQLREAFAACLVKEEDDRPLFDAIFTRFFAGTNTRRKSKRHEKAGEGSEQSTKSHGGQSRPQEQQREQPRGMTPQPSEQSKRPNEHSKTPTSPTPSSQSLNPRAQSPTPNSQILEPNSQFPTSNSELRTPSVTFRLAKHQALLDKSFQQFDARDVEESKDLVEVLARQLRGRLSRRYKRRKRGRIDFRRTIRASILHGGVPIEVLFHGRRPGKPDLLAFCDLSGSVAAVSDFLLALIAPASSYFRRVRSFAYVDRLCEVSFENGHVVPHAELDLYARSDFGRVLQHFWQDGGEQLLNQQTLVLILGDARNNRRPPRPDLLARLHNSAKKLVWLNPEPPERWNTGDSVMRLYTPACDSVFACGNLRELLAALHKTL
ncbi:MAG: VWA domain-containing protein [Candidatus Binatia bacterium]